MHVCIIYTSYPTPDKDVRQIRPELHEGFRKRRKGFASFQRQTPPHPRRFFRRRRYRGSARRAPTDSHKEETRGRQIATMAGAPDDATIRKWMEKLVPTIDLHTMTAKIFIGRLQTVMGGVDLTPKKKFIKATLAEIINEMSEDESSSEESSSEESSDEEVPPPKKKAKRGGGGGGGGGLKAPKEISDELATVLGQGRTMARTEIVKALWVYIRENDLQNPKDKRQIICDETLRKLFHTDRMTMVSSQVVATVPKRVADGVGMRSYLSFATHLPFRAHLVNSSQSSTLPVHNEQIH